MQAWCCYALCNGSTLTGRHVGHLLSGLHSASPEQWTLCHHSLVMVTWRGVAGGHLDTATLIVLILPHWRNMTDLLLGAGRGYWLLVTILL